MTSQHRLSDAEAQQLAHDNDTKRLASHAAALRDIGHKNLIGYSRKVFLPLTQLCRDVCHYCTFAQTPRKLQAPYLSPEEVLTIANQGRRYGCKEALLTLGEKPELRYRVAREALQKMGYNTTLEYVEAVARLVFEETGLLPHINAGCMTAEELEFLRPVSASMGIMLESSSSRLCQKGMPHFGSPDKLPEARLETIRLAGEACVPITSGVLIGIGETREERIESLLALRALHEQHGHIQEIIIQNFRAKSGTLMATAAEPDLNELLWTIAVARILFGAEMNIQAPPNLSPGVLPQLIAAGINDWGGVSPVTPDFVNPEAPWPQLEGLEVETQQADKYLQERLTVYPAFIRNGSRWLATEMHGTVLQLSDSDGFARTEDWLTGGDTAPPEPDLALIHNPVAIDKVQPAIRDLVSRARNKESLTEDEITSLFQARGPDFAYICQWADRLRAQESGEKVSYVVNRNINYTNICYFKCQFCAFSKGKLSANLRGRPYQLNLDEVARRSQEAWERGATEVCLQGGIHPEYTGQTTSVRLIVEQIQLVRNHVIFQDMFGIEKVIV
ncbi:7,8-didemethyl-8-hydroxy-5-deazariboflavin synthase CofG [Seongchinamella sediminis]|nr:7,8-didemethyl-8-hydroxy-5-deazariboflavin synthase CofG [Seongchinamella sediminis]